MYSELLFGHKRITSSLEVFSSAKAYIKNEVSKKVIKILEDQLTYFNELKKGKGDVSAMAAEHASLTSCVAEFTTLIPSTFPKPSVMYRDKNMYFHVVGKLINAAAHHEFIKFKDNKITVVDVAKKSVSLAKSPWNNPSAIQSKLVTQIVFNHDMMKNLALMEPEKGKSETTRTKIITLTESIILVIEQLTEKYITSIHNFCVALEKGSTEKKEEPKKDDTKKKEDKVEKRNFLQEYKQAIK